MHWLHHWATFAFSPKRDCWGYMTQGECVGVCYHCSMPLSKGRPMWPRCQGGVFIALSPASVTGKAVLFQTELDSGWVRVVHCTSIDLCKNGSPLGVWQGAGDMCMGWKHSAVSILDYRKFWGAFSRYSWFICESQLGTCPIKADFPGKLSIQIGFFIDSWWRLKVGHLQHRSMKGLLLTQSNQINYNFSSSIKKYNKETFFALLIPLWEGERGARKQQGRVVWQAQCQYPALASTAEHGVAQPRSGQESSRTETRHVHTSEQPGLHFSTAPQLLPGIKGQVPVS